MSTVLSTIYAVAYPSGNSTQTVSSLPTGSGGGRTAFVAVSFTSFTGHTLPATITLGTVTLSALGATVTSGNVGMRSYAADVATISGNQTLSVDMGGSGPSAGILRIAVHIEDGTDGTWDGYANASGANAASDTTTELAITSATGDVVVAFHAGEEFGTTYTAATLTGVTETAQDLSDSAIQCVLGSGAGSATVNTTGDFTPASFFGIRWVSMGLSFNADAGGPPDEIIAPVSADATSVAWRQQLATWQQATGGLTAPLAADVVPPPDQITVDGIAWLLNAGAWQQQLATWQQATGLLAVPLADNAITDISGSADGSVVFTGSASGTLTNEGSATGAVVFGGSASGALRIAGSATGVAVFGGSATGAQGTVNSGSATGTVRFTGSASGQLRIGGAAASGAALFTGSAFGTLRVQGSAVGVVVFSGLASGDLPNEGSAAGAVVFTGSASGSQGTPGNAGSATGSVVFTGAATGRLRVSGAASGVVVFRGAAGLPDPGSGDSSGRMRRKRVATPYQFLQ